MVSVMAIESEVWGSCVGAIDVSVENKNGDALLYFGLKYPRFILASKATQNGGR
jgi:hypothetical protein